MYWKPKHKVECLADAELVTDVLDAGLGQMRRMLGYAREECARGELAATNGGGIVGPEAWPRTQVISAAFSGAVAGDVLELAATLMDDVQALIGTLGGWAQSNPDKVSARVAKLVPDLIGRWTAAVTDYNNTEVRMRRLMDRIATLWDFYDPKDKDVPPSEGLH